MKERYEIALADENLNAVLRNIYIQVDGLSAIFDMIPSVILDQPHVPDLSLDDPVENLRAGARPIVEGGDVLRVHFGGLHAIVIQEEEVDVFSVLDSDVKDFPKIKDDGAPYPFLRIKNSRWKASLPSYRGRDDAELHHYKIISLEINVDIIAYLEQYEWVLNDPGHSFNTD